MGNQNNQLKGDEESPNEEKNKGRISIGSTTKNDVEYEEEKQLVNYRNLEKESPIVDIISYVFNGVRRLVIGYRSNIEILNSLNFSIENRIQLSVRTEDAVTTFRRIITFQDIHNERFLLTISGYWSPVRMSRTDYLITIFKLSNHPQHQYEKLSQFLVKCEIGDHIKMIPKKSYLVTLTKMARLFGFQIPTKKTGKLEEPISVDSLFEDPLIRQPSPNFVFVENYEYIIFVINEENTGEWGRPKQTKIMKLKISETDQIEELLVLSDTHVSTLEVFSHHNETKLIFCWNKSSETVRKYISVLSLRKIPIILSDENRMEVGCSLSSILKISNDFMMFGGGGRFYTFCPSISTSLLSRWKVTKMENQEESYIYFTKISYLKYKDHYVEFATSDFESGNKNVIQFWRFKVSIRGPIVVDDDEEEFQNGCLLDDDGKERISFLFEDSWLDFEIVLGGGRKHVIQTYKFILIN